MADDTRAFLSRPLLAPAHPGRRGRLSFWLLALVTAVSAWYLSAPWRSVWQAEASREACVERLAVWYRAFDAYRRDHGRLPKTPADLFPHYLRDASLLACPSYRPARFTIRVTSPVVVAGRRTLDSYYFPYLALDDPAQHLKAERVPLMVCRLHAQELHEEHFRQVVIRGNRMRIAGPHRIPFLLVLRQDGVIMFVNEEDQELGAGHGVEF